MLFILLFGFVCKENSLEIEKIMDWYHPTPSNYRVYFFVKIYHMQYDVGSHMYVHVFLYTRSHLQWRIHDSLLRRPYFYGSIFYAHLDTVNFLISQWRINVAMHLHMPLPTPLGFFLNVHGVLGSSSWSNYSLYRDIAPGKMGRGNTCCVNCQLISLTTNWITIRCRLLYTRFSHSRSPSCQSLKLLSAMTATKRTKSCHWGTLKD